MKFVVRKAWFSKNICHDKIDEFRTVVRDGNYAFGVFVRVLEKKNWSEGDIIIIVYNRMCQDIERFITARFYEQTHRLENRIRVFRLDYNLMFIRSLSPL